jgi:hypothetical protein
MARWLLFALTGFPKREQNKIPWWNWLFRARNKQSRLRYPVPAAELSLPLPALFTSQ